MKNTIYAVVIAACLIVAVVVFLKTRGGGPGGVDSIADTEQTWVKCRACSQSYEMSLKEYYKQSEEKSRANPTPMPVMLPLTCEKCGKDGVLQAEKCEKCGAVFFLGSVPADFQDRCPECKHSKTEALREARRSQQ